MLALVGAPLRVGAAPIDKREVQARKDFAAGRYEQAAELFAELFALTSDPIHLRNIARCYQSLKRPTEAISNFENYLRKANKLSPTEREEIQGYIKEMEALQAAQRPAPPRPEPEQPAAVTPAPAPAAPSPGMEAKLPIAIAPAPTNDDTGRSFRVAGIATGAAGVALLATGLGFGIAASSASDAVGAMWDPDKDKAGNRYETLQWVGYGLGAAALGTGIFLYAYGHASAEPKQAAGWQIRTAFGGKGGGGVAFEARF
jgi:tetratricopeptide (TPR) repeat protein